MRDPPQKTARSIIIATCQGNSPRIAGCPLIIRRSAPHTYTYQAKYTITNFNKTFSVRQPLQGVKFLPSVRDWLRPPRWHQWLGKPRTDEQEPYCAVPRLPFGSCAPWRYIRTESGEKFHPLLRLSALEDFIEFCRRESFRFVKQVYLNRINLSEITWANLISC
jgi:hypothetical protein